MARGAALHKQCEPVWFRSVRSAGCMHTLPGSCFCSLAWPADGAGSCECVCAVEVGVGWLACQPVCVSVC